MPSWRLSLWQRWAIAFAVASCTAGVAHAQSNGFQVNRYEPTPAGDPFFRVEHPWYSSTRYFAGGLTLDYAHKLIAAQHLDSSGNLVKDPAPIEHGLAMHFDLAASLFDRVALSFSMPLLLYEAGTPFSGVGPSGVAAGDPRIGIRVRLFGQPDRAPLSMSLGGYIWIPIGADAHLIGDAGVRAVVPRVILGGVYRSWFRWSFNADFYYRATAQLSKNLSPAQNSVGSSVDLGAAAAVLLDGKRLSIGPELNLSFAVARDLPAGQRVTTAELFVGGKYHVKNLIQLGLGVGFGLAGQPGPPDYRGIFSIAYAPMRKSSIDSDGDRVPDHEDACPRTLGGPSSDPKLRGCPHPAERVVLVPDADGHVGALAVNGVVIDKAYQSTETGASGKPQVVQSSPEAVQRQTATLPPLPPRPTFVERVTVLPDEDGHVGAVEVNDGKRIIVLDKAYATSQVDSTGQASETPAKPEDVAKILEELGAALPSPPRPTFVERVTVLPDEDGHVGAVEVNDGKRVIVLDKGYATSQVDSTGQVSESIATPENVAKILTVLKAALPLPPRSKFVERVTVLPDEDGHVGAVEVNDGKRIIVLDKAYATSQVDATGHVSEASAKPEDVAKILTVLNAALPVKDGDLDKDGIADSRDACPDRAGVANEDPARNGCPRPAERVTVIPDEDGHVGAVAVDDGKTVTVLDQAYATSEVGSDGVAIKVEAKPAEVAATFSAALKARSLGVRMIIYFTEKALPTRDLTGPIANIVSEIKSRGDAVVEVVGHTDAVGSAAGNLTLGKERAQLIAARLIAAGVSRKSVKVMSKGGTQQAVPTTTDKPEPRNRRVEVFVR